MTDQAPTSPPSPRHSGAGHPLGGESGVRGLEEDVPDTIVQKETPP
ncbi:MAG: hypothetical protein QOF33_4619 [Thermomicrobiales bacterium]|jgi:hypothetical protein|nr:hypothetical protein [Thermomicrobiales bacterium]MEA2586534.1 hypothetical protein [Thermomicrobiales bacterium]